MFLFTTSFWTALLDDFLEMALLLAAITCALSLLRRTRWAQVLQRSMGQSNWRGVFSGAFLGVLTPVCSCSVTPLYLSLLEGGASPQAAAAFLFAAPAVNEYALLLAFTALGWKGALFYAVLGLVAAAMTGRFCRELGLLPKLPKVAAAEFHCQTHRPVAAQALATEVAHSFRRLWFPMLLGAAVAVSLEQYHDAWFAYFQLWSHTAYAPALAVLVGLPLDLHATAAGTLLLPIAKSGIATGTMVSLLMATTMASLPEGIVLQRFVGWWPVVKTGSWYALYAGGIGWLLNFTF